MDAIAAAYAGAPDTEWLFGANHIHTNQNWNRMVVWPGQGFITPPGEGAQGFTTETGGIDDKVWKRNPQLSISIWAEDTEQAENRLHAVLIAIDDVVSQADICVSNLNETWVEAEDEDNTSDGAIVILVMNVAFDVLAHDIDQVAYDAATSPAGSRPEVGDGGPTETVTEVTILADNDEGDDIPPVVIT
jgi:hypothetical protein